MKTNTNYVVSLWESFGLELDNLFNHKRDRVENIYLTHSKGLFKRNISQNTFPGFFKNLISKPNIN